ncbi:MAG: IS21 family transposase [Thermodesulfobacteriota bacterium]
MYQYRQIIHRMRMGESDRAIAKTKLIGRTKCAQVRVIAQERGWLAPGPLPDDAELAAVFVNGRVPNSTRQSLCAPYVEQIQKWIDDGVCWSTIHEVLVDQFKFAGSYSSVRRLAQKLKQQDVQVTCILDFVPGEAVQVDFGKGPTITDVYTGEVISTWIFVMTLCFSRHMYAEIVLNQKVETWLSAHRRAFEYFGGVPAKVIIDNARCAITKACLRDPEVQRVYGELAEGYGFLISPCPPGEPQKKGRVEVTVKYIKNHFLPLRQFRSLVDANNQLRQWLLEVAGNRIHGTTKQRPLTVFAERERRFLHPLPEVAVELATWNRDKVHGDCHVRFEQAYYSAPFRLVHQQLWLKATDTTVKLFHNLDLVAVHPRLRKPGARSTVDEHLPPEVIAYKMQDPQWCLRQAEAIGPCCQRLIQHLFTDQVLDNLRAAQGIIGLAKKYGALRLESACQRALFFDNPRYRTVKSILKQGLDQMSLPTLHPLFPLSVIYTAQARFLRSTVEFCSEASPSEGEGRCS